MARALTEYFGRVYSSDAHAYGAGAVRDFLFPGDEPSFDWIITNPPFRLAEQFAHTMIDRAVEGCAILVRTSFLEGIGRYKGLFSQRKPSFILQFTERVPMHKGRVEEHGSTATSYCWIVWTCRPHRPDASGMPVMAWIPPCRRKLERPGDYTLEAA
ncbi:MAG: methyltransferase [Hyphomicrobiales bacterium]|nr:MAG: methyltransferase [Hyphomicrobiales bacterium]